MVVSLEFLMDTNRYRVTRRRTVKGRSGSTELQFEGWDGDMWRPLAEGSIGQTQDAINRLIRMSHDTFVHASFVQQGKADAFMMITPQQRKQVLGDILGLGRYDELADAAREGLRDARSRVEQVTSQIRAIETELAKREEYTARLGQTIDLERQARELVDRVTTNRTELMREVDRLLGVERLAAEKKAAHAAIQERAMSVERQLRELAEQLARAQALTGQAEQVERQFAEHQQAEREEQDLASRFDTWNTARDQLRTVEAAIERERIRLETELVGVQRRVVDAQSRLGSINGAADRAKQLQKQLAELDLAEKQLASVRTTLNGANERLAVLRQEGERLKAEPDNVRQRIELLGKHDECPLCGQMLGHDGLTAAQHRLQAELQDVERKLIQVRKQYAAQANTVKGAQEQYKELQDRIAGRAALERDLGGITSQLQRAEQDRKALVEAQQTISSLELVLANNDYAQEHRVQLQPLRTRLESIGYDQQRHATARATRDRLREAPARMRALDAARATMETAGPHQLGLEMQLTTTRAEAAKLAEDMATLIKEAAGLPGVRETLRTTEEELQAASTRLRQASQLVGEARQMVAWLESKERESAELAVQRDALARDVTAYTQLAEAFGKNGIQEMVVEQALPEIEEIANDLLARLTDGRMRLTLVTQRQGRTVGSINTLDILVRDELGSRPYELFSGGEKFRINFSVRIALSKLLARRANAPLQMLAVDEGFGSQDRDGCDRLIEAIRVVQDDFEKVLVITHLEELKDAFPVRIEVTKGPTGSTFALV
jgi:exonuclease SbcC